MFRPLVSVVLAALLAASHAAEANVCAAGDSRCVTAADHALLATKVQVSKLMAAKDRIAVSTRAQPIPPVSTTMKCVISVTILYFVIWTSLFVVSSMADFTNNKKEEYALHGILEGACDTVVYAPMISVLFILTRMRAIAITHGDPEAYGLPQWWCKDAMVVAACTVYVLTFCSLLQRAVPAVAAPLTVVQYLADATLYGAFAVVAFGLYVMDAPPALGPSVPISGTAKNVMNLAVFYFAVAILHQAGISYDLFSGKAAEGKASSFTGIMHHMLKAMDFAPQICILFLAARMRAVQLGHSDPQQWAIIFFFAASTGIQLYSIFVAIQQVSQNKVLSLLEVLSLLVTHASIVVIIYSVFTIEAKAGPTPFISTTVRVVMGLTVWYFFVHTALFASEQLTEAGFFKTDFAVKTFEACIESVMFVPMMCALFVGTRMRALQLSHNMGAPQGWAQDLMMLATWAILIDLVVIIGEHMLGSPDEKHVISRCFQAICLMVMHASTSGVIASIFLQTVENTSTNGADQLIPGIKIPGRA